MEKFLNYFLAKFCSGGKDCVYLSVTPGVGLEMIQIAPIDPQNKTMAVKAYACKPLAYSESRREIDDYDQFKIAFEELCRELNVNVKCNVALNLPIVMVDKMDLSLLLSDENVSGALTSAAEQSYLFKRTDPVITWFDASVNAGSETKKIVYSAIQKSAIDNIKGGLESLGATLVSVETSLTSYLRALDFTGLAKLEMQDGVAWNLMIVNPTGYSIIAMQGKKIIDTYEEPIALKTYETNEVYAAISESVQLSLMNYPATYMFILSETELVSAELLAAKIPFDGTIHFIENNSYRKDDYIPVSLDVLQQDAAKISLSAIGVGVSKIHQYPIKLDFVAKNDAETKSEAVSTLRFTINSKEYTLTEKTMCIIGGIIVASISVFLLLALVISQQLQKKYQDELKSETAKVDSIEADIKKLQDETSKTGFVVKTEIENVLKSNRAKLMAYSALGSSVPRGLWITYFATDSQGKVDIKGSSENVEDIYIFFKNMRDSLVDTQMRLHSLEMSSSLEDAVEIDTTYYNFEITNMSDLDSAQTSSGVDGGADPNNKGSNNNNSESSKQAKPAAQAKPQTSKIDEVLPEIDMD